MNLYDEFFSIHETQIRTVWIFRSLKKMTRIEKAVKIVSDLYDFYRKIPKISDQNVVRKKRHSKTLHRTAREPVSRSPESPLAHRR